MKRLNLIGVLALAVSVASLTFGLVLRKEPHFQGRSLTQWLVDRPKYKNPFIVRPAPLSVEARRAVKAIGTNAIPILLEMIQARDSAFKTWLTSAFNRQRIIGFRLQPATEQRAMAFAGFEILGEEAKAAAPALASLIKDPDFGVRYTALESLRRVTSDKNLLVPLLLEACHDSAPAIRFNANTHLHFQSPESLRTAGIPDLLDELFKQGTNDCLRHPAPDALRSK